MADPITSSKRLESIFSLTEEKNNLEDEKITVHAAVSRISFVYEKIRNLVDYKDDHLLRKAAIARILKRLLFIEKDPHVIAEHLIRELIAARYLPNGVLPQSKIDELSWRVYKLQVIQTVKAGPESHLEWVLAMVAVEIEDLLIDSAQEKALVSFLFDRVQDSIRVRGGSLEGQALKLQIYLACNRMLIKADDEILGYKLLRAFLPEWLEPQNWMDEPRPIAERLLAVERRIKLQLRYPLSIRFQRAVKPWAVALNMLGDIVRDQPEEMEQIFEDADRRKSAMVRKIDERFTITKSRVRRATIRAMVYLLLTKMIFAVVLEVPIELYLYSSFHVEALAVNLLFPPILMFIVGRFIRLPDAENSLRIVSSLEELLSNDPVNIRILSGPARRTKLAKALLTLMYLLTFVITFGLISFILELLAFSWISTLIFLFFLCLVSFFAFRIRNNAREHVVVDGRATLWGALVDFFSIPVLRAGRFLSQSISRINIFLFFFDFIFEMPYKMFLVILEEWFAFAKEKKDELQP